MSAIVLRPKAPPQSPAAARAGFPLAEVGRIDIPQGALDHRHILEARALTEVKNDGRIEAVIGTTNIAGAHRVQLYGWGRNVDSHADETGWIYFCPLILKRSIVAIWENGRRTARVYLRQGHVYRLNDYVTHWTQDTGPVVALYCGVFTMPDDATAIALLQDGANALATGGTDAPRVSPGFRMPFKDECFAEVDDGKVLMPIAQAKRERRLIATCTHCRRRAWRVDSSWPWCWDQNRCEKHLRDEAPML